jgi:hypothetical protein
MNTWKSGRLIQYAFPRMSSNDRELLITGICTECWDGELGDECDGN